VKIVEVWDDFIGVEVASEVMRTAGQFRGGGVAYINIATITRLEMGGMGSKVQDSLRTRLR
jgi:hypothetical protein